MKTITNTNIITNLVATVGLALSAGCGPMPKLSPTEEVPDSGVMPKDAGPRPSLGIPFEAAVPNVMLVVDRSGSMAEPSDCGQASCPSKWEQLVSLGGYLADVKTKARLGLTLFPAATNGCSVDTGLVVPLSGASNVDECILEALQGTRPGGKTPAAAALSLVGRDGNLTDADRDNVVVLLTDGQPNCSCVTGGAECESSEAVEAVVALRNQPVPIETYVVGFGASARGAHETLSAMAEAAGTAAPAGTSYYQADTIEELVELLYQVVVQAQPCDYYLDNWPEPDRLIVWQDDQELSPCTDTCEAGYTYDPTQGIVVLHGASCEAVRNGTVRNVWFDERDAQ